MGAQRELTFPQVQEFLDRYVLEFMVEGAGWRDPLEVCYPIRCFECSWVTRDMARAILRGLTDRGLCRYASGLLNEDGMGAGYGVTQKGLSLYESWSGADASE